MTGFEDLVQRYNQNAPVRALVQLVSLAAAANPLFGFGPAVDAALSALAARQEAIRLERARTFYDELELGSGVLTPRTIESEAFLHDHLVTLTTALRTRRVEKIRWLARLLLGTAGDHPGIGADEYEDYLGMLDQLSYRELCLLNTLAEYEEANPLAEGQSVLQRANHYWPEFRARACQRCIIPADEFDGAMQRLTRSGAYVIYTGTAYDYEGNRGYLTPAYFRLAQIVRIRAEVHGYGE